MGIEIDLRTAELEDTTALHIDHVLSYSAQLDLEMARPDLYLVYIRAMQFPKQVIENTEKRIAERKRMSDAALDSLRSRLNRLDYPSREEIAALPKAPPAPLTADDHVDHPPHYTKGKIEVWDFIVDQDLNFLRGSALKYICRAGTKDPAKETEDLRKAIAFLNREIKRIEDGNQ